MRSWVKKNAIVLIYLLLASHAYAANSADMEFSTNEYCIGSGPGFGGKPVNLRAGDETFTRTDLTLGSFHPITINRSYSSASGYDSPVGYGWAINHDRRIYTYPDGSVTLRKECGWKRRFAWSVGGYISPVGDTGTLVQNADGSFIYAEKDGSKEQYDVRGRLAGLVDAKENTLVFTYSADARDLLWGLLPSNLDQNTPLIVSYDYRLSKIEEKDATGSLTGKWVALHYELSTGRLTDILDSTGRTVTYSHDSIGNLTSVEGPAGSATYGYLDSRNKHRMTSIDEGQGTYLNTYDSTGKVIRQTHGTGVIDFAYTHLGKETSLTTTIKDSVGAVLNTRTRTVDFDSGGQVCKETDTFGNITTYLRESNTWVLQEGHTDIATGVTITTAFTYDSKGNTLSRTEAMGTPIEKTTTYTYDPTYSKVLTESVQSVVDPGQDKVTTYTYDPANGNLLSMNEAGLIDLATAYSYTTSYGYDAVGHMTSIDGPRTDVQDITTFTYDPLTGNRTAMTQPLIGTTVYGDFDLLGNPRTVIDPNGNSTIYTYDANGKVLTVKAPGDANSTQYFYVGSGCTSCGGGSSKIDHITLPEGNAIWYTYDSMGNLSAIKDSANNTINYTYDSEGNKLTEQIKDSAGSLQKTLSYSYDALNRIAKTTNPDSAYTQYTYDGSGNRISLRTPNSTLSTYSYDALNRLIAVIQPGTIITSYGYNTNSNLSRVTDANGNATIYKYDDKGRVYQTVSPDTGTTTYGYDPADNLTSKTDAKGVTISYVYDAANRITKIDFPTDTDIVYVYDTCVNGKGRLCGMTDASGTTTYEYTTKRKVKKETKVIDSITYVTQYSYDQNGNLKTMTYPSGRVITYNYTNDNAVSVLNNAANLATNINYKPFGNVSSLTYGNGLTGSISYDNQYRGSGITAGTIMNLTYADDANANITAITNALDATKNKSFGYDALDRLTGGTGSWGSLSWTYDSVGNRLTEGSTVYSYAPSTNKLTGEGGLSFGYDNNGNTTSQAARSYTYNQNQRLIQVADGAMIAGYTYNGSNQRVKKIVNGEITVFHYDQHDQLIAESNSTGMVVAEYVYLEDQPLAKLEGANIFYYHNDHLGTPQKMTDGTGVVVWSAEYKPFGEATVTVSTITNNLRFPGQYYDAETGLNYNLNRDYNPVIGRYIEVDPLGLESGINPFIYVANKPITDVDPTGLAGGPPMPKPPPTFPTIPPPPKLPKTPKPPGTGCNAMFRVCMAFCATRCPGGVWGKGVCIAGCTAIWVLCVTQGGS